MARANFASDCTTITTDSVEKVLYCFEYLKALQSHIYNQARGSAQPHVYPTDIMLLPFLIPKQTILDKLANIFVPLNEKMTLCSNENQELARLRDWLLPMLMNGQVTVEG